MNNTLNALGKINSAGHRPARFGKYILALKGRNHCHTSH